VPHGGRNFWRREVWRQMYISQNFWFDHLFFENQSKININPFETISCNPILLISSSYTGKVINPEKDDIANSVSPRGFSCDPTWKLLNTDAANTPGI
jgi:hypothetical protein